MDQTVGIDDMAVHVPRLYVDLLGDFAAARGLEPAKLQKGLGVERMAVPDRHEDAATMGAMSALRLIRKTGLKPEDIGRIYIGTESSVDESKNMGGYIVGMLEEVLGEGSLEHVGSVEFKFACIGTTYALESAVNWIRAGENDGKAALVISSDIARYDLNSAGEYTQGAGSVAMLVRENPRLLAIEPRLSGAFTKDENDFYRPTGKATAVVNGKHSNACYMNAMKWAMVSYAGRFAKQKSELLGDGATVSDHIDYMIFHIPYPRMAEHAGAFLFRHEWRGLPRWKQITQDIGEEPKPEGFDDPAEFEVADYAFRKAFTGTQMFRDAYEAKVLPSLEISRQIGNIYTGSMYLAFASMLEGESARGRDLEGQRVGFGSYGSGCSSIVFSGIVQPGWKDVVGKLSLHRQIEGRRPLSMIEYESLHEGHANHSVMSPKDEYALDHVDDAGYRHYKYVE